MPGKFHSAHPRKLYGRRKGWKLSAHQAALVDTLLPELTLAPRAGADPKSYFATPVSDVWLEVGFGGGEHLAWQAEHHPDIGLIGAEPFEAGVAKLLSKIAEATPTRSPPSKSGASDLPLSGGGTTHLFLSSPCKGEVDPRSGSGGGLASNIRIYMDDARDVIAALPDASLGRVFILFPDPWPKTRHHKRRFIQMEMLDQMARVLRTGAELRFATDDPGYLAYALERFMAHPSFRWTAQSPADWRARTDDWPQTRYEAKQLHGTPSFLRFVRV